LDFDVITDPASGRNNDILTDITILSYHAIVHDMAKMPNPGAATYLAGFIKIRRFMDKYVF
jgi:hypothetical protein